MQITPELKLTWDCVVEKFQNLIRFAAKQQVRNYPTDTSVSVEDLEQEGMIKLYDCWMKWCVGHNKDMDEFGPIFRTSLFRRVRQCGGRRRVFVDLEDATIIEDEKVVDVVEDMYMQAGLTYLKDILSTDTAKNLLNELIQPSEGTLFEAWADLKRKEMVKSQGHKVNVPKDFTVRMKHIMRALGITTKQYDTAMLEIREKARVVLRS